jgi:hypothetical protein
VELSTGRERQDQSFCLVLKSYITMTFTVTHTRAFSGNDLSIKVLGGKDESVASVTVTYDGFDLEEVQLAPNVESYERIFSQAGQGGPGVDHTLEVSAIDGCGKKHASVTSWTDTR